MREIKFRVWNGKKMIQATKWADILVKGDGRIFCWVDIAENSGLIELDKNEYELMQYTGLKDKNGVEIYEGDVLSDKTVVSSDLDWNCSCCNGVYGWQFEFNSVQDIEVIGNIYENPELLAK